MAVDEASMVRWLVGWVVVGGFNYGDGWLVVGWWLVVVEPNPSEENINLSNWNSSPVVKISNI